MLVWSQLRPWGTPVNDLATFLETERLQRDWSRERAGREAHLSKTAITNILNGRRRPTKETLQKIAEGWGLSLDYLLELAGIPRSQASIAEQATAGLTTDQLAWLASLTPEERRFLVEAGQRLRGDGTRA